MLRLFQYLSTNKGKGNIIFIHHILSILLFSLLYFIVYQFDSKAFMKNGTITDETQNKLSILDIIQYTIVTQTTIGYGNITANSFYCKILNVLQMLFIYGVFLVL
jgi:hypothetical protein